MYRARGWRSLHKALFLDWTPAQPPHDLHTLMKLTTSPLARKPTQMWDAKKIENTPTLPPPHPNTYPIIHTIPASYSASGPWPPFNTLQTFIFKPLVDVCRGCHPESNSIFEKKVFQGPHRTILGHPKHVLHLVPSPNAIAKAFNVM